MDHEPIMDDKKLTKTTVVFFDWDDTVFATTHIGNLNINMLMVNSIEDILDVATREHIIDIERMIANIFEKYHELIKFYIVTNADMMWIELCLKCCPKLSKMNGSKVTILSAKDRYEMFLPMEYARWKYHTYTEIMEIHKPENIIGFGDSYTDMEAIKLLKKSNIMIKSLKFTEKPTSEQLFRQIELMAKYFEYMYMHDGDLDLQLSINKEIKP